MKGQPGKWFKLENDRFSLRFDVSANRRDTVVALASELVEYRLARYFRKKAQPAAGQARCKVLHASGRPIVRLDRKKYPNLPREDAVAFVAEERTYLGDFKKEFLNVARRPGVKGNELHPLLRGWFGPAAGLPGTDHFVLFERAGDSWAMTPDREEPTSGMGATDSISLPLFSTYRVACGAFDQPNPEEHAVTRWAIRRASSARSVDPQSRFLAHARGDSMNGGPDPIRNGDILLFEWVRGLSRKELLGKRILVSLGPASDSKAVLRTLARTRGGGYALTAAAGDVAPIAGTAEMSITARLVRRMRQPAFNPLFAQLHERCRRMEVAELHGETYNPGNWNTGHVSLNGQVVLFVTLEKSKHMTAGAQYQDRLLSRDSLSWSSQTSTTRTGKKGQELLRALDDGRQVHVWLRRVKTDVEFVYAGMACVVEDEGEKPIRITWRLYDALPSEVYLGLGGRS